MDITLHCEAVVGEWGVLISYTCLTTISFFFVFFLSNISNIKPSSDALEDSLAPFVFEKKQKKNILSHNKKDG